MVVQVHIQWIQQNKLTYFVKKHIRPLQMVNKYMFNQSLISYLISVYMYLDGTYIRDRFLLDLYLNMHFQIGYILLYTYLNTYTYARIHIK